MTQTERAIAAAREHLTEARRWCRTRPEAAKTGMSAAVWDMTDMEEDGALLLRRRLMGNLHKAMEYILTSPTMAEGYIDGALFELQAFGDRLRLAREAGARDAELAEAYGTKGDTP